MMTERIRRLEWCPLKMEEKARSQEIQEEAEKAKGRFPLRAAGETPQLTPAAQRASRWPAGFQNRKRIHLCCFKPLSVR